MRAGIDDPRLAAFADEVGADDPVAVVGAKTRWSVGGSSSDGTRLVSAPSGIVARNPEEMTVHVGAGATVAELHRALAEVNQRTALPDRGGTVGGALAVGENALLMRTVGRVRHCLLEVRYVAADGRRITGGGPTVKNVSGFDLPRLMVGSLGTLGLIGDVILRTNPIPAVGVWVVASDVDPFAVDGALFAPAAVLWERRDDLDRTWVRLEGHADDVAAQQTILKRLAKFAEADAPDVLPPHRWSVAPSRLSELDVVDLGGFVASVGVGTVWAQRAQPPRMPDAASSTVARRLKDLFDPSGRLNPGRDPAAR